MFEDKLCSSRHFCGYPRIKTIWSLIYLCGFPILLSAGVPEGNGNIGIGIVGSPGQTTEIINGFPNGAQGTLSMESTLSGMLEADFPIWSGFAGGLKATTQSLPISYFNQDSSGNGLNQQGDAKLYVFDIWVKVYLASFAGLPFMPGKNANPDGWLLWPSIGIQYEALKANVYSALTFTGTYATMFGAGTNVSGNYILAQITTYSLCLPLLNWATLEGGYSRNNQEDTSYSSSTSTTRTFDSAENESLDLRLYLDMIAGAGADHSRAFVPHLGRQGQLMVDLGWVRSIYLFGNSVSGSQTYSLTLGTPITDSLGLTLGIFQNEPDTPSIIVPGGTITTDNRDRFFYQLILSWALGSPRGREDK